MNEQPTHLDLFSGIGGFAIAALCAGFRTVAFCEIDPYCQAVLKTRFKALEDSEGKRCPEARKEQSTASDSPRLHRDIFRLDGRLYTGVTLITGGFPCQPFSCAGKRRGKEDDRYLWPEMLRIVSEARPAWVLGENVAGIVPMELDRVLSDLENIGYAVWPLVIPACAVDARHRRDRVWIVAFSQHAERRAEYQEHSNAYGWDGPGRCGETLANSIISGLEVQQCESGNHVQKCETAQRSGDEGCRWLPEPNVGRVAYGIPNRVDRLKGLGNAIVPQVAYEIIKVIWALSKPSMAGFNHSGGPPSPP